MLAREQPRAQADLVLAELRVRGQPKLR
jgi:hypothetical protein